MGLTCRFDSARRLRGSSSAGDVGRFAYCPLNWKLSLQGHTGKGGQAGIERHEAVAEQVDALDTYQTHARMSQDTALLLGLFAMSAAAIAVEVFYLDPDLASWWILLLLSVLWAAASLYLVVFNLHYKWRARRLVHEAKLQPGSVVFADSSGEARLLESKILPLRGRPDYVTKQDDAVIPVEVKAGRTPKEPYDSHVLQLAAYCYLVEETYQQRPPYGIVSYPDRQFRVDYSERLENRLVRTLLRIELAQRTGDVHRDHEIRGRCLGCSRRDGCPERLA